MGEILRLFNFFPWKSFSLEMYFSHSFPSLAAAAAAAAKLLQSCPTLCDPIDGSPPGSAVPGILQARNLEWVAISFSNAWKWKVKVKSLSEVKWKWNHSVKWSEVKVKSLSRVWSSGTWLAVSYSSKPLFQEDFPKQSREVRLLPYSLLQNSISWSPVFFPSQHSTHSVTTSFVHILLAAFSTKTNTSRYQRSLAYWPLCLQLLEQFLGSNMCSTSTC